jgi:hypothetical protein
MAALVWSCWRRSRCSKFRFGKEARHAPRLSVIPLYGRWWSRHVPCKAFPPSAPHVARVDSEVT